ncbi:nuclear transport factor 2 family protein [Aminobacter aminovorans]|uniref:Lumazine-binding n=1 Tax=Aminobacter aminovorans TaxID=83263 RepID=A0AAC8YW29_AMIAI|nr:nuclear transport factor 2 family protein [Aminobacter aminovorans]AMS45485.1 hypothetical protein AA2016_6595 [Aminobacter aminovorans]MBB3708693.1 hypothetical protein [Aminobacter aminovorans]
MSTETNQDHVLLLKVWEDYCDGIYSGDVGKLERIFHPASSMFFNRDKSIVVVPISEYFSIVANREAPAASGAARREKLISLSVPSPDNAVLTATILIAGKSYTDQLALIKENDRWLIVAKTYHLDSVAEA